MTKSCSYNTDELRRAFKMLTGKCKLEILFLLHQSDHRFGELKRSLPGITQHMLTSQLRELEADGLISRQVYAEVPPRVEYALMPATLGLTPVIEGLLSWCRENSPRIQVRQTPAEPKSKSAARVAETASRRRRQ
ncbi:MAG: helix-turn-helix domain-containing protein [Terriglobales bacterium]